MRCAENYVFNSEPATCTFPAADTSHEPRQHDLYTGRMWMWESKINMHEISAGAPEMWKQSSSRPIELNLEAFDVTSGAYSPHIHHIPHTNDDNEKW